MRHADAIGEEKIANDCPGDACRGIITDDPAVAAALQRVDNPFLESVADRGLAKIDLTILTDRNEHNIFLRHIPVIDRTWRRHI